MKKKRKKIYNYIIILIGILVVWGVVYYQDEIQVFLDKTVFSPRPSYALSDIPAFDGEPYVVINNNEPNFIEEDYNRDDEVYSDLDYLHRCGPAFAKVGINTMPTTKRGSIGMIKPSGWHTVKYDIVDGKYLYNRCHLIGYQLTGENANEKNLITCTRFMNTVGMLQFENKVADYVKDTHNHVLYRVSPIFVEDDLVASGVEIEALSIEDKGAGIKIHVFVYNVQEGITIDYSTGDSKLNEGE